MGSSLNLSKRLAEYYCYNHIVDPKRNMAIYRALLKHGYSSFTLEILEYCEPSNLIEREQYFIDLVKPEYNILQTAGSSFGFKHSEETKIKMSKAHKEIEHCGRFTKGHKHTEETLAKLRGRKYSEEAKIRMSEAHNPFKKAQKRVEGAGKPSKKIEVFYNKTNLTTTYESISEAARALEINQQTISMYFKRNAPKPCKGRYILTEI